MNILDNLPLSKITKVSSSAEVLVLGVRYPVYDTIFSECVRGSNTKVSNEVITQYKFFRFLNQCDGGLCLTSLVKRHDGKPKFMGIYLLGGKARHISGSPRARNLRKQLAFAD